MFKDDVTWQWDLFVVNVQNGNDIRQLTYTQDYEMDAGWSPDGKKIAFISQDKNNENYEGHLYIMDADGTNRTLVTDFTTRLGVMSWSPDGSKIVFRAGECPGIYVVNIDGSGLKKLTDDRPIRYGSAVWTTDGIHILFTTDEVNCEPGGSNVKRTTFIMNADGSAITPLSIDAGNYPAISPVPAFIIGRSYIVGEAGNNLNLRDSPSLHGKVLKRLSTGDGFIVLDGPVDKEDYYWWHIQLPDGTEGWIVEVAGWTSVVKSQ